jgi:hypothetical protein
MGNVVIQKTRTKPVEIGDYIIKDRNNQFHVYTDRGFRQYFEG